MTVPALKTFEAHWPRSLDEAAVRGAFRVLAAATGGPITLEIWAIQGRLRHLVTLPTTRVGALRRQVPASIPGLQLAPLESGSPSVDSAQRLKLSTRRRALRTDTAALTAGAVLAAMTAARRSETVCLQWILGPRLRPVAVPNNFIDFKRTTSLGAVLAAPFSPPGKVDPEQRTALRDKQSLSGWRAVGRIGVTAETSRRRRQLAAGVLAALRTAESPALRLDSVPTAARHLNERRAPRWRWPLVLNELEIVGLAGWPLGELALPTLNRASHTLQPAATGVARRGRVVGDVDFASTKRPIALNGTDALRHLLVLGPTGVGKSTVMGQLALADAAAGRGLILIDNRRDLIDAVMARLPEERLADVVVLDPSDQALVVGFNPLAGRPGEAPLLADRIVNIFRRVYGDNLGPRSEDILHAGLLTLALSGGRTLPMLPLLFTNASFRRQLIAPLDDPLGLGSFWSWFEGISEAERRAATAPLMNKLRSVLLRPALRRALGQAEPRFSIRQVFSERKILLVNLAKGELGPETAQLFGALLLNEIWQHALSRASLPAQARRPVMLHVDEFHEYLRLPTPLADVLVAARGYGLGLTIATQHLEQLTPDVRAAVLGNAGSRVVFRLSQTDARILAQDSTTLTPDDFRGLGAYEAYASLMAQGARTPYASIKTRPFEPELRHPQGVRRASAAQWGRPAEEVDLELRRLTEPATTDRFLADAPVGRRKRRGVES
jgi:hypothetical protein